MDNTNKQNVDFYKKYQEIRYDMSTANLEDVEDILNHYNQGEIKVDGVEYHYDIDPLNAACLNARYKELTGQDHPTFIKEQGKVLDEIIKFGEGLIVNGQPSIYQRLKNNLTGEGLGIGTLPRKKGSYIDKYDKIHFDISKASLEDVKDILDHYDQDSVLIEGVQCYFRPNVIEGACLNARYKELTGQDHPIFVKEQEKILDEMMKTDIGIRVNEGPTVLELLKSNNIEIGNSNHIINRTVKIFEHPEDASLEDITSLLNHYNGNPVLIDGIAVHPSNDPLSSAKLNEKYKELTGQNHPVFAEQALIVIKELKNNKKRFIKAGAFGTDYYDKIEQLEKELKQDKQKNDEEAKKGFLKERENQRYLDAAVRARQLNARKQAGLDISSGGMNR